MVPLSKLKVKIFSIMSDKCIIKYSIFYGSIYAHMRVVVFGEGRETLLQLCEEKDNIECPEKNGEKD